MSKKKSPLMVWMESINHRARVKRKIKNSGWTTVSGFMNELEGGLDLLNENSKKAGHYNFREFLEDFKQGNTPKNYEK